MRAGYAFLWIGLACTLKRIRDANLPSLTVLLFFLPVFNVFSLRFVPGPGPQSRYRPEDAIDDFKISAVAAGSSLPAASAVTAICFNGGCGMRAHLVGRSRDGLIWAEPVYSVAVLPRLCLGVLVWIPRRSELRRVRRRCSPFGRNLGRTADSVRLEGYLLLMAGPLGLALAVVGASFAHLSSRAVGTAGMRGDAFHRDAGAPRHHRREQLCTAPRRCLR